MGEGEAEQAKEGHNLQSILVYEKCIFEIKKIYSNLQSLFKQYIFFPFLPCLWFMKISTEILFHPWNHSCPPSLFCAYL